jgi:MerR family transcriptional regulator, redox-sensitive transcriptional activator SoxR
MAGLTIGQVAARTGVAASAIRYYEREGLIAKPPRRGGRRVYDPSILDQLGLIDLAKRAGFTVAEVKRLLNGFGPRQPPGARWRALTRAKMAELEARIAEAERMRELLRVVMRCRCPSFAACGRALRSADRDAGPVSPAPTTTRRRSSTAPAP